MGAEALIRFYLLHVMILPLTITLLLAVHFWRVRKDGGLTRPGAPVRVDRELRGRVASETLRRPHR